MKYVYVLIANERPGDDSMYSTLVTDVASVFATHEAAELCAQRLGIDPEDYGIIAIPLEE